MIEYQEDFYFSSLVLISVIILLTVCFYYQQFILAVIKTLPRDFKGAIRAAKWQIALLNAQLRNMTLGRRFEAIRRKKPNKICLYFENDTWTFEQVGMISNQVGNYFYEKGLREGDTVALFMENAPEYIFTCLGLSKIGVITSLVNSHLRLQSLDNYLHLNGCKALIFNSELYQAVEDVKRMGGLVNIPLYFWGRNVEELAFSVIDLNSEVKNMSAELPFVEKETNTSDRVFYFGTSGTTGLPKAAIFTHTRFFMISMCSHIMANMNPSDITYISLPLYHTMGFLVGMGNLFCFGCPIVLRKKFSASTFWSDCCRYNATVAPYIGETCRYLLATEPTKYENEHKVRIMVGAGLRSDIWQTFVDRFKIPMINEVYGSTEGNCGLINIDGKVGAAGFYPILALVTFVKLIKVNEDTMEPLRNPETGNCILCDVGEPGELVGQICSRLAFTKFEGYTDKKSTNSKILRNAFRQGDSFFRTGDLFFRDIYGYFYFKDRQGDTFRWKSENVSTFEVESLISQSVGLNDVAVYGVSLPGYDGKAGMAAISNENDSLNLKTLSLAVSSSLPFYARPVFLRVTNKLEITGSFKIMKSKLKEEGLKFPHPEDQIYILQNNEYIPLTPELYQSLLNGKLRI